MDEFSFSPVRGGPLAGLRRILGLDQGASLALARRAAVMVAVTWLPVVAGALFGQTSAERSEDPILRHFGIHARLLLSVPVLIFAESIWDRLLPIMTRHFVRSGLVDANTKASFREVLAGCERLRDSKVGTAMVVGAIVAVVMFPVATAGDEMAWAYGFGTPGPALSFAAWWYVWVSRPVFVGIVAIWLWRLIVCWTMLRKIARLDLRLVPTHPDRAGGLGFMENFALCGAPIVFAFSVVIAGRWGHEVMYHGVHVDSLQPLMAALAITMVLIFAGPLILLSRNLRLYKRRALLEYGALVGQQGRLVQQKWIQGEDPGPEPILEASEIGPVCDANSMYEAVAKMRLAPMGRRAVAPLLAAVMLPMIPVFAIEVPIKEMLLKLATTLI